MTHDEYMRRAVESIDVTRLPPKMQRASNSLLNLWQELYGGERPSKLDGCSDCQLRCDDHCSCWCHGDIPKPGAD